MLRPRLASAVLFLCLPVLVALSGCETVQSVLAQVDDTPTARVTGVDLAGLSLDAATLDFDVEVRNPYSVPLPLASLDYSLASGGAAFLTGAQELSGTVEARDRRTVTLPATISFPDLLAVLGGVRPGQVVPYAADLALQVDAPGVGPLELPLRTSGEVPVPAAPEVRLAEVTWDELSLTRAAATLAVDVRNTNTFALDLAEVRSAVSLGGRAVGETSTRGGLTLDSGEQGRLEIPIAFAPVDFGVGLFNLLRGSEAPYGIEGALRGGTPYGLIDLPFTASGNAPLTR